VASAKASKGKTTRKSATKPSATTGRPPKWDDPDRMEEAIDAYFAKCDTRIIPTLVNRPKGKVLLRVPRPEPYTIQGLAVFLDLTTDGLYKYGKKPAFVLTIKRARAVIEANAVMHMLDGDGPVAGQIFNLKNNYHWTDRREISGPGGGPIVRDDLAGMTNAQLEKRLKLLTGGKK